MSNKTIEVLEAENKRLFDAHSVEMVRADKLQQEVGRLLKRLGVEHGLRRWLLLQARERIAELKGDIDELVEETGSLMQDRIKHLDRIAELEKEVKNCHSDIDQYREIDQMLLTHIAELETKVNRTCKWSYHNEQNKVFGIRFRYVKTECGEEVQSEMCDNFCWNCGGKVEEVMNE